MKKPVRMAKWEAKPEVTQQDVMAGAKRQPIADGHKTASIKSFQLYLRLEEYTV